MQTTMVSTFSVDAGAPDSAPHVCKTTFYLVTSELSVTVLDYPQRKARIFYSGCIKYGIVCQFIVRLTTASLLLNDFQINK